MNRPKPEFAGLVNARILITGANGFIAGGLLPRLVECGAKVVAVAPNWGWRPWVISLVKEGKITFVEADALTPKGVDRLTPYLAHVDCVIHLARVWAQGNTPFELATDEITRNLLGTIRFLSKVSQYAASIVYPSSIEVYGPPELSPLHEDYPLRPVSPYAVAKVATEGFLKAQGEKGGTAITILRYATVYGPGELEPRAVPNFIRAALTDSSPVVDGEGRDVRDYVYVADVVEATLLSLSAPRAGTQIYNVGTGFGCTTIALARLVLHLVGSALEPVHRPIDRAPQELVCDISRASAELGYVPAFPLQQGLAAEIQWFRDNLAFWRSK